jgi:hypothetical protein
MLFNIYHTVQLSDQLFDDARRYAGVNHRTVPKQIEYWASIGKLADENPDLSYDTGGESPLAVDQPESG